MVGTIVIVVKQPSESSLAKAKEATVEKKSLTGGY